MVPPKKNGEYSSNLNLPIGVRRGGGVKPAISSSVFCLLAGTGIWRSDGRSVYDRTA